MSKSYLVTMSREGIFTAQVQVEAENYGQAETVAAKLIRAQLAGDRNTEIVWEPDGEHEVEIGQIALEL